MRFGSSFSHKVFKSDSIFGEFARPYYVFSLLAFTSTSKVFLYKVTLPTTVLAYTGIIKCKNLVVIYVKKFLFLLHNCLRISCSFLVENP